MAIFISIVVAYLLGVLPFEYLWRYYFWPNPIWLWIINCAKGVAAVLFAWFYVGPIVAYFCAIVVVIGHMYPFYSNYSRSGLMVATGALIILSPIILIIAYAVFLLSLLVFRRPQLSLSLAVTAFFIFSIVMATSLTLWFLFFILGIFLCSRSLVKGWFPR
ncbi:Glycerol-3-phosphate acyltransferase [Seinonella peptonophila]|uniref:Glycerol-3-phosphate acyltransferase n=1 Tax=Seinonella peptonophila TaxID=112248 RepID=A0A1M5AI14_9BACL|nr:glycerol-3-phosphate acyltransferase [Seinonella peptonophila]SHF29853.1 Glycerol-3-phosphate acyltransferase [Seinonella peptonophila]